MDALNIEGGRVFTVDFEDHRRCRHPRITFLGGDSANPKLVASIAEELDDESPRLISLDSDHSTEHVYNELTLCAPLCRPGDWLVVEDTNIGWSDGKAHIITSYGGVAECTCGARWAYSERLLDPPKTCPNNHSNRGARGGLEDYLNEHPGEFRQDIICERYLLSMNPGGWLQRVAECRHA
jgi:cephalosporin hydroxylase